MPSRVAKKIKQLTLSEQQRIRDVLAKKGTATQQGRPDKAPDVEKLQASRLPKEL